jgi:hypothetical protein
VSEQEEPFEEDHGQYREIMDVGPVNGLVKREVFDKIGLYDEKFFFTSEEVDFCYRAKEAGYRIVVNPNAKMWHFGGGTVSALTPFHVHYLYRGKLRFGLKNFHGFKKIAFIVVNILLLPFLILRFILNRKFSLVVPLLNAYWWNLVNFGDYL